MVFLTKIDAYDPDLVGKDLTKTFHSIKLLELCKVTDAALAWAVGIELLSILLLILYFLSLSLCSVHAAQHYQTYKISLCDFFFGHSESCVQLDRTVETNVTQCL